ncbi:hypothetical protein TRIUR3_13561 [Triticum urartu]|uniref:Uncharacterized protein n=1 Tax=Triticum urartu TaxID=4572 RepID=M7ZKA9_TRIUA|nr:hypothetical protein TRIUR3_13561 [Triticum urartu]
MAIDFAGVTAAHKSLGGQALLQEFGRLDPARRSAAAGLHGGHRDPAFQPFRVRRPLHPSPQIMWTQSISPASVSAQFPYPATAAAAAPSYFPVPFHLQTSQYPTWPTPAPAYNAVYPMPQVQQAQQLFQRDSQIISPEALATVKAAIADNDKDKKVEANKKAVPRKAAGQCWEDPTLADWPES